MIDQETIQRIMETAKIEEVIGDFVSLKRRGSNHIGCCPFHNEKTPSFYVSPSKGIFKCFGCGEAGDVVAFLKKHEHFTYPEALRWLANRYHIEIHEEEMTEEQKERQTERDGLFHVSEFAQKYFADILYNDEMGRAVGLSYFHGRGLSDEIIKRFGLGYSPEAWTAFTDYARKAGYSDTVLEKTGLTIFKESSESGERRTENGERRAESEAAAPENPPLSTLHSPLPRRRAYDRFRGRVMFPIYSISGRVLGFSGRILSTEKQAAKYVNSPDSDIYNKSRILYGLYQARSAIARADKCYLVEGNVDVISMHQSGVENTVASCGTSLTTEQIRLIKRYTLNVTVLYDGDSAGIKAALRAVDLLFAEGMKVRVALFPDGEDPDSYAQKYGSTQLQQFLATHEDNFIMYKTRVLLDKVSGDPIRRAELVSETARSIALVTDLMERQEYIRQCSYLLKMSEEALTVAVAKAVEQNREKRAESARTEVKVEAEPVETPIEESTVDVPTSVSTLHSPLSTPTEAERHLVQLLLNYGNTKVLQTFRGDDGKEQQEEYTVAEIIISDLKSDGLTFSHPLCQRIFEQCALMLDMGHSIDTSHFIGNADQQLRTFAAGLMMDTYSVSESWFKLKNIHVPTIEENLRQDLTDSILTFKQKRINQIVHEKYIELRDADQERQMTLLGEIGYYNGMARQLGNALNQVITSSIDASS